MVEEKTGTDEIKLDHSDRQRQLLYGKNINALNLYCFSLDQHHRFRGQTERGPVMSISVEGEPVQHRARFPLWQLYLQRYRTRRSLLQLDDVQLADIGLSRAQAMQEGRKPFWRT
nr:DUF1127 domain-containing protein [Serratia liquefaciens]